MQKTFQSIMALFIMLSNFSFYQPYIVSAKEESSVTPASSDTIDASKRELNFNDNWKFALGSQAGAENPDFNDNQWESLNLPHDWSIYFDFDSNSPAQNEGGLLNGGTGWYRKEFNYDTSVGKNVRLYFGGVYMDSTVYVNGKTVGNYPNGYTPFSYDITDYLVDGENT